MKTPLKMSMALKPASTVKTAAGMQLTAEKTGDVRPKPVSEFSKEVGAPTPLPIDKLVDMAFPAKSAGQYAGHAILDGMIAALGEDLTKRSGSAWQGRLVDVAAMLRDDPDVLTVISDEGIRTIMAGIEMFGSTDVSRAKKEVVKEAKLDSDTMAQANLFSDAVSDVEFSFDFDMD